MRRDATYRGDESPFRFPRQEKRYKFYREEHNLCDPDTSNGRIKDSFWGFSIRSKYPFERKKKERKDPFDFDSYLLSPLPPSNTNLI